MSSTEFISVFDIFKIGVGPSSSHTMGPWRAAQRALARLREDGQLEDIEALEVALYGSLAKTGKGHGTDIAVLLGLSGEDPTSCDTTLINQKVELIQVQKELDLLGIKRIPFDPATDIHFHYAETLPYHPNGIQFRFRLLGRRDRIETYYSVGGGFVVQEGQSAADRSLLHLTRLIEEPIWKRTAQQQDCQSPPWCWRMSGRGGKGTQSGRDCRQSGELCVNACTAAATAMANCRVGCAWCGEPAG